MAAAEGLEILCFGLDYGAGLTLLHTDAGGIGQKSPGYILFYSWN